MVDRASFPIPPLAAQIFALAASAGSEARIVGGAVRDFLAGRRPGDIDMAVAMPIEQAAEIFRRAGLRVIETGLRHGTVTVRTASAHAAIEVTQTRVDVVTDGRHATIEFSADWKQDASRRDFTINAIYICADGSIADPLDGEADLRAGRLHFVGDAGQRVREDALRMLRYCRLMPAFGGAGPDPEAIAALCAHAGLAAALSGERVAAEMARLLVAPGAGDAIALMHECGIDLAALGLSVQPALLAHLPPLAHFGPLAAQGWLACLALIMPADSARALADRLRLSRRDAKCLAIIDRLGTPELAPRLAPQTDDPTIWQRGIWALHREGVNAGLVYVVATARAGGDVDLVHAAALACWNPPKFPISGADLLSHGVDNGPALGQMLETLEQKWVDSSFTLTRKELLACL
jgi:tRNA nucleotidyltransferase/poly(A) polymerase